MLQTISDCSYGSFHEMHFNLCSRAGKYVGVPQAAGQVKILIFLAKFIFFLNMQIIFVMQGKCLRQFHRIIHRMYIQDLL